MRRPPTTWGGRSLAKSSARPWSRSSRRWRAADAAQPASPPPDREGSAMTDTNKGACFCGAVEVEATGAPVDMGYCHCASCRTYAGAPLVAFTIWPAADVAVTKGAEHLGGFNKVGTSDRKFCVRCGGHLF